MPGTVLWFALVIVACAAAWFAGRLTPRIQDPVRRGCLLGGAVLLLIGWSALIRHPTIAVQVIPVAALARLEGVGAAPLFIFIVSIGWQLAVLRRQRALMLVALVLCAAYFFQGGLWMMRPTPTNAFSHASGRYCVRQTQDYSCVPAASATALRILGLRTNEAEMAQLSETRPGSGATLLRALNGLSTRLTHTGITPQLLEPSYDQLIGLQPPILTPLRYERSRLHMVTVLEVRPHMVIVADPQAGIEFLSRHMFETCYNGQVIAFTGGGERATAQQILAQYPHLVDPDTPRPAGTPHARVVTSLPKYEQGR